MAHRALKRRARTAQQRVTASVVPLSLLSGKAQLTEADKAVLPRMRRAAHQAMQYQHRLKRRYAKRNGDITVPTLMRASFKVQSAYKRIQKHQGPVAAHEFLLARIAKYDSAASDGAGAKGAINGNS